MVNQKQRGRVPGPRWAARAKTLAAAGFVVGLTACGGGSGDALPSDSTQAEQRAGILSKRDGPRRSLVDLRVDSNRDGMVDMRGDSDTKAKDRSPALFLANLDDDTGRCTLPADLLTADPRVDPGLDERLAACNDAADDVVNGPEDEKDLIVIRSMPLPAAAADGQLVVSGAPENAVRLFLRDGAQLTVFNPRTQTIPARLLRQGVELRLEGRDIIRNKAWDGTVKLTLRVAGAGEDTVTLQQAPLLLQNNLQDLNQIFMAGAPATISRQEFLDTFGDDPFFTYEDYLRDEQRRIRGPFTAFRDTLDAARVLSGLPAPLKVLDMYPIRWAQDIFEPAYTAVPGPNGEPHLMRVLIRSPNRQATARIVFTLRGPNVGVVQQSQETQPSSAVESRFNSLGNLEALPPYKWRGRDYPAGRILIGRGADTTADPSFVAMLAAQRVQPVLEIDTSWLSVGHVDEIVHVIPGAHGRRWTLAVPDPRMALKILKDAQAAGHGKATLFTGRQFDSFIVGGGQGEVTVDEVLANTALLAENEKAAVHLDRVIGRLLEETGLRDRDLVRLPVMFRQAQEQENPVEPQSARLSKQILAFNPGLRKAQAANGGPKDRLKAFTPNLVNGLLLPKGIYAHTRPEGPVVNGVDLLQQAASQALVRVGLRSAGVDAWDWVHTSDGEVHCGTNAFRMPGAQAAWWLDRKGTPDRF